MGEEIFDAKGVERLSDEWPPRMPCAMMIACLRLECTRLSSSRVTRNEREKELLRVHDEMQRRLLRGMGRAREKEDPCKGDRIRSRGARESWAEMQTEKGSRSHQDGKERGWSSRSVARKREKE